MCKNKNNLLNCDLNSLLKLLKIQGDVEGNESPTKKKILRLNS